MKPNVWKDFLALLHQERAELDAVIHWVEQRAEGGSIREKIGHAAAANGSGRPITARTTSSGRYADMSITEAAKDFLASQPGTKSTKEIADALLAGGYASSAQNFASNVYGSLQRSGDFRRVRKKWRLAPEAAQEAS